MSAATGNSTTEYQTGTTLTVFNTLKEPEGLHLLTTCCASPRWQAAVLGGRPFATAERLYAHAAREVARLRWADVLQALSAHPRIGRLPSGEGTEDRLSRAEQSGVRRDPATASMLERANREYENRFGHIFLICATGLDTETIVSQMNTRLAHDPATEHRVVAEELAKIVIRRLRTLVTP